MTLDQVKLSLDTPQKIVITSHRNPDGDAIGSSLALYHFLQSKGHSVNIIFPSLYPVSFEWMPQIEKISIFDTQTDACTSLLFLSDIIFVLDYNSLDRVDKMGDFMKTLKRQQLIMIDHHREPDNFVDYMLSDITASSTCELVYDFILSIEGKQAITPTIADCVYTGIVTDTGSFKFSTSPKLFRTVASLLELGARDAYVQDLIFNSLEEKNLRLLGHVLYNRMEILPEFKTGIVWLTKKDYEHFDIQRGDTEGIVNNVMMIRDIHLAIFITEQPTIVKLSLRSKGDFSVQEFCRDHFNGGGHKNASGGYSNLHLRNTIDKIKSLLPVYKDRIVNSYNVVVRD